MKRYKLPPGAKSSTYTQSAVLVTSVAATYQPASPNAKNHHEIVAGCHFSSADHPIIPPKAFKKRRPVPPSPPPPSSPPPPPPPAPLPCDLDETNTNADDNPIMERPPKKPKFKAPPGADPGQWRKEKPEDRRKFKLPPANWSQKPHQQKRRRRHHQTGQPPEESIFQIQTSNPEAWPKFFILPEHQESRPKSHIIDRQRPASLDDLIGQSRAVHQMRKWAKEFIEKRFGLPRALLLTGPTGVGKSTAAHLLFQELNLTIHEYACDDFVETNKSAQYGILSEKGIDEVIYKLLIRNDAFGKVGLILDDVGALIKDEAQKKLVDVLSGAKYARQFQKNIQRIWQAPVIIICDLADMAGFSRVARICEVVEFAAPGVEELSVFLGNICKEEQLEISPELQHQIVRGCGGDVRRLLNTLHFICLAPPNFERGNFEQTVVDVTDVIDVNTAFYSHHSLFEVVKVFLEHVAHDNGCLTSASRLIELYPVSLAMLLQENMPRIYDCQEGRDVQGTLDSMADTAEFVSSIDILDQAVHGYQHQWEMEEVFTTLSTWGVAQTMKSAIGETINDNYHQFEKSSYFGNRQREKYRRKLIFSFPKNMGRGQDFADVASVICAMITHHVKTKTPCQELLDYCASQKLSYKDLQDMWKCMHAEEDGTMPNLRGNLSLRKLIT
jgi:DNA polymerase III delta prime subunit